MKNRVRLDHKQLSAARPRPQQRRSRRTLRWVLVSAVCIATFIGVLGIASAAQHSGGPLTLAQKMQSEEQRLKNARAHPRPKPGNQNQAPPVQPAPTRQAGILPLGQGPFPQSSFTVHNFWQGPVGSNWELVYAGAKKNPADDSVGPGALKVYTEVADSSGGFDIHLIGTYPAPKGAGVLTIVAVNGSLMQLRTDTGSTLVFNLQTNQYS